MSPIFRLGSRDISQNSEPYIVAEIGVNHEGSLSQAKKLVDLAARGGANAAKFQSYRAETLAIRESPAYWDIEKEPTTTQYELFQKYSNFGADDYRELAHHCQSAGLDFLSTPFDDNAVEYLDPLVPGFKIASSDITNLPLLRKVASTKKPVILSTGASTVSEISAAISTLREAGTENLVLLHCILNYPTQPLNAHLGMISGLRASFPDCIIGYSDHTLPDDQMSSLVTAYLLGAVVIEKHFTNDKSLPGNDHYHSMDYHDLVRFRESVGHVRSLIGPTTHKKPIDSEADSRIYARRSIVLSRDLPKNTMLTADDLTCKRPGTGLSPLNWDDLIGRRTTQALTIDHLITLADLSEEPVEED
jgi:sialic acid synthase SpsE